MREKPRWTVTIDYLSEGGIVDVIYTIRELEELHDLVERGPNWYCIDKITIKLIPFGNLKMMTLEEAEND